MMPSVKMLAAKSMPAVSPKKNAQMGSRIAKNRNPKNAQAAPAPIASNPTRMPSMVT